MVGITSRDRDGTIKSWNVKKLKPGETLRFEDGSSITRDRSGKLIKRRSPSQGGPKRIRVKNVA